MKQRFILLFLAAILFFSAAACASGITVENEPVPNEPEITASPTTDPNATVEKLQVVSFADRMSYLSGERFDPTGLIVNALMSDGTVKENVPYTIQNGDQPISNKDAAVTIEYEGKTMLMSIEVKVAGNAQKYSVAETETLPDSPLRGKVYYWLGSSVTFGASSEEESMVDFIAKRHGAVCIKEAVSGTTLNAQNTLSYVERFDRYLESGEKAEHLDGFICQLSTNDTRNAGAFGQVLPDFIVTSETFDTKTTFGAIEYIIAKVRETWDCPVYFYINPPYNNGAYARLADAMPQIAEKWGITLIDMFHDEAFNDITEEERVLYMADMIHPTKAGYREWWLPKFEEALEKDAD